MKWEKNNAYDLQAKVLKKQACILNAFFGSASLIQRQRVPREQMRHKMGGAWVPGLSHGGKIYNNQEHTLGQLHKGKINFYCANQ